MAKKFREKLRRMNPFAHSAAPADLPQPLPADPDQRLVKVYVCLLYTSPSPRDTR